MLAVVSCRYQIFFCSLKNAYEGGLLFAQATAAHQVDQSSTICGRMSSSGPQQSTVVSFRGQEGTDRLQRHRHCGQYA